MINFALFGAGRIGILHAKNIYENEKTNLSYVYDINKISSLKIKKQFNCKIAKNIGQIVNDKNVDAVLIASPTSTHIDLILKSARNKKSILCEKPIDLDINKIIRCQKKLSKYNVPIQIGFNRRFDKGHLTTINKYKNGEIGKLENIIITSRDPSPPPLEYLKNSGGIFRDMTIHDFDLARFILGKDEIGEVLAFSSNLFDKNAIKAKDFDTVTVILKSKKGVLITINNSRRSSYGYDQRVELFGSKGMIISDNRRLSNIRTYNKFTSDSKEPINNFFIERYFEAYKDQLDSFVKSIIKKQNPIVSFEDGKKALIIANAAYESLKLNKIIKI